MDQKHEERNVKCSSYYFVMLNADLFFATKKCLSGMKKKSVHVHLTRSLFPPYDFYMIECKVNVIFLR